MDDERRVQYCDMLTACVESGKLTPKVQSDFESMKAKAERYSDRAISTNQYRYVYNVHNRLFPDGQKDLYQHPTKYSNCELVRTNDGMYVQLKGRRIGSPLTKKEGVVILAWLTKSLPDINNIAQSGMTQHEAEIMNRAGVDVPNEPEQPLPFDNLEDTREDNYPTNTMLDTNTGELVMEDPF